MYARVQLDFSCPLIVYFTVFLQALFVSAEMWNIQDTEMLLVAPDTTPTRGCSWRGDVATSTALISEFQCPHPPKRVSSLLKESNSGAFDAKKKEKKRKKERRMSFIMNRFANEANSRTTSRVH